VSDLVKISEAASLGLHTMALLARESSRRFTNQQIADTLSASGHHLAKVMQRLAKAGLVTSIRGPQGGFELARTPEELRLLEIYEAVEGPFGDRECFFDEPICNGRECVLGDLVQSIHKQIRDYLTKTTLAELAKGFGIRSANGRAPDRQDQDKECRNG
jgi:Rrf2 family protein